MSYENISKKYRFKSERKKSTRGFEANKERRGHDKISTPELIPGGKFKGDVYRAVRSKRP